MAQVLFQWPVEAQINPRSIHVCFLVNDQLDAQFFPTCYFNSLHVSSNLVRIIRRINCISATSGVCHPVSVTVSFLSDPHTKRSPTQSDIHQMLH